MCSQAVRRKALCQVPWGTQRHIPHRFCPQGVFCPQGSIDSDTKIEQFPGPVSGTADADHGHLEQAGYLVDSGGTQVRGEAEAKFPLLVPVTETQSRSPHRLSTQIMPAVQSHPEGLFPVLLEIIL